ncbi:MAG: carboxylating nicotinate-nucleotide diphosphorylase [Dehalococcoidia bacterium]
MVNNRGLSLLELVRAALDEDGAGDDLTTRALVPPDQLARAVFLAKGTGVIAGIDAVTVTFQEIDSGLRLEVRSADGSAVSPGDVIAIVDGSLGSILRGERTALNFLTHLSGIATVANDVMQAIDGTTCRLRDTRKTIPGLRMLEKAAAAAGGATNHRFGLWDGVLVKDNHLAAVRGRDLGIQDAVRMARESNPGVRIEVEVTSREEAREAAEAGVDELLLDNMSPAEVREIVEALHGLPGRPLLEASGGITLDNARDYAETGVDFISMGAITHSAPGLDISLEVEFG